MDAISLILGVGIAAYILVYLAFKLDDQHSGLKLLNVGFAIILLVLIAKTTLDYDDNCDFVVANETVTGNLTQYDYDYLCDTNDNTTSLTFYETMVWYVRIFMLYIFLFMSYMMLRRYTKFGKMKSSI